MPEPIDVILLSYNRADYLARMVDALERNTVWPFRITVVDNVSGPETRTWLRQNAGRFHQIVWNRRNEHLAGHQRGIDATTSELFVVSDADLIPHPPTEQGCWLTRLVGLAERHPDFGLLASRIDSDSIRTWDFDKRPVIDDEIIEARTGVWLNIMRRSALRVPYMSDGITCYALRRAGYRVGIARDVFCTHLGDEDAARHPDYLARKQAATRLGTVYPDYPEVQDLPRPPTLEEVAWAAPVLAALESNGVDAEDVVELTTRAWAPVAALEPRVESAARTDGPTSAALRYAGRSPLTAGGARAVAVVMPEHDAELLTDAQEKAAELVVALTPEPVPELASGWEIADERPSVHPALQRLARLASRRRWRERLGYSTVEHGTDWQAVMRAGAFGEGSLRLYVLRRSEPLPANESRWEPRDDVEPGRRPTWHPPLHGSNRLSAYATMATRVIRAEWHLLRSGRSS